MRSFNYEEYTQTVLTTLIKIGANQIPVTRIIPEISAQTGLAQDVVIPIVQKVKPLIKDFSDLLEKQADEFYDAGDKFISEFSFKTLLDERAKHFGVIDNEKSYKKMAYALGEFLMVQFDSLRLLDVLTKPATIGGVGLNEISAGNLMREMEEVRDKIEKYNAQAGLYPIIINYMLTLGIDKNEILKETKEKLASIKEKIQTLRAARKNYQPAVTEAKLPAESTEGRAVMAEREATEQADSLSSLIDQLSKEIEDGK